LPSPLLLLLHRCCCTCQAGCCGMPSPDAAVDVLRELASPAPQPLRCHAYT
jgi:hypothetical protein